MKKQILFVILLFISSWLHAQSGIENVLAQVERNNKTIASTHQFWEARLLEFKTGISLPDPQAEADYLWGNPTELGNQTEFNIFQPMEFPTVYFAKHKLADAQAGQSAFMVESIRQTVLLEAKQVCLELIFRNRQQNMLDERMLLAQKLVENFETRLDAGDANILELNKAKILLLQMQSDWQLNSGEINRLNHHLTELNGGDEIVLTDTIYPTISSLPDFESLENTIEENDPVRKSLEQQMVISEKQISLSRQQGLPNLEAGYHYQEISGTSLGGIHFGFSIPLWENKNAVKQSKAENIWTQLQLEEHRTELYYESKQLYEQYTSLMATLESFLDLLPPQSSLQLLDKALQAGEISTIEYFFELSYFYSAHNDFAQREMELQKVVAELLQYQL